MRKPNFLIVGAAKSGTTSLFQYLRGHPDVFMPDIKEASYFAGGGIPTEADYLSLFRHAGTKRAVGEASGAYLYLPETAAAIQALLGPAARIVIILRNPIDMAYSLWGHMRREGNEPLTFSEALKAEKSRMADPAFHRQAKSWSYNFAYLERALYARQVARYLETFDPSRVHVLIFEEFFADAQAGFAELCRFLDIASDYQPVFQPYNQSSVIRSQFLHHVLEEQRPWKNLLKALTPLGPRLRLKAWLHEVNQRPQRLPPLSHAERVRLWQVFSPDVAELERLLGRRLECWGVQASSVSLESAARAEALSSGGPGSRQPNRAAELGLEERSTSDCA